MLVAKSLLNSIVSTKGAWFTTMDISNFYLMTPLKQLKYRFINLREVPDKVIQEYGLKIKAESDGLVYIMAMRGMYGLPQSRLLTNELLERG